jgi:hypothetical protein
MHSSFRDRLRQTQALGNGGGGWRARTGNGGVDGGHQRAMVDADEALSTQREVIIK